MKKLGKVSCGAGVLAIAVVSFAQGALAGDIDPTFSPPEPLAIAPAAEQPAARLIVGRPLTAQLSRGLVVIPYRTENLRIVPVYGAAGLEVNPRIGHIHVTVDESTWHWADASGEPLIIQGLMPGRHQVLIELADPTHRVIDRALVELEIPAREAGRQSPDSAVRHDH